MSTLIRANSLYTSVDGPTWIEAETNAALSGGHLVTITDAQEYEYILNLYSTIISPSVWIGLNDHASEGIFEWSSGEHSDWTPVWAQFQPDNAGFSPDGEDYIQLFLTDYTAQQTGWTWLKGTTNDLSNDRSNLQDTVDRGLAEVPLNLIVKFPDKIQEGSGEFTTSIELHAGTILSGNLAEGAIVHWKITGITADDLVSGDLEGSGIITNSKLEVKHSLGRDADRGERFEISVFSDPEMNYQIGATATVTIQESEPDQITGILDVPRRVYLANRGLTPFELFGNKDLDVTKLDFAKTGFGVDQDSLAFSAQKNNETSHVYIKDLNADGYLDAQVQVSTAALAFVVPKGSTNINGYSEYSDGTKIVFALAQGDTVLFV